MFLNKIGIMQGRLSKPESKAIQSFPTQSWQKEFVKAKKLSIKFIEWTLDYKNLHKNPLLTNHGIRKIRYLTKKYNIKVKSITGDCFMQKPFWQEENAKKREILIKDLKKILNCASILKIRYIVIPLVDKGSLKKMKHEKILVSELMKFKNFLLKKRMFILFETDFPPKKNLNFIKIFNSKNFGFNYDIGNSASLDYDPVKEFRHFGKYIKNVHIKDRKKYGKTVQLGEGNANYRNISKLFKKIKYKGNFILQTARGFPGKELENISKNLTFLKQYQ